jgi:hypothetical protein
MPSAVLCSLLAGISAVIELHYAIDYSSLAWSQQWCLAAVEPLFLGLTSFNLFFQGDSTALAALHAILAFSLQ